MRSRASSLLTASRYTAAQGLGVYSSHSRLGAL